MSSSHTYATAGTFTVTITADDGVKSADAALQIVVEEPVPAYEPEIVVPAEASPGDTVAFTGTGFAPEESVSIRIDDEEPVVVRSDEDGAISGELMVPEDALDGDHPVVALGVVSNTEARGSIHVSADTTTPKDTSVALAAGSDDPVAGESVALIATVKPAGAAGKVDFLEGDTVVGSATVTGGTASADVLIATSGEHTFVARFVPSDPEAYNGSDSKPLTLDVRGAPVLDAEVVLGQKSVVQGGSLEITGRGFAGGETVTVTLHSDPIRLGQVTTDGTGAFRIVVTVPASAPVGAHTLIAVGADSGLSAQGALQVTAAAGNGDGLAGTGGAIPFSLLALLLVLLAAGGILVIRRRRQEA